MRFGLLNWAGVGVVGRIGEADDGLFGGLCGSPGGEHPIDEVLPPRRAARLDRKRRRHPLAGWLGPAETREGLGFQGEAFGLRNHGRNQLNSRQRDGIAGAHRVCVPRLDSDTQI